MRSGAWRVPQAVRQALTHVWASARLSAPEYWTKMRFMMFVLPDMDWWKSRRTTFETGGSAGIPNSPREGCTNDSGNGGPSAYASRVKYGGLRKYLIRLRQTCAGARATADKRTPP